MRTLTHYEYSIQHKYSPVCSVQSRMQRTVPYALYSPICNVQSHMHHTAIPSRMQRTLPYAAYGPVLYGPVCSVQSRHTVLYPTGCVRNVDVKRRIFGAWTLIYRRECVERCRLRFLSRPTPSSAVWRVTRAPWA